MAHSQLCRTCGTKMTEIWPDHPWHPLCAPSNAIVPGQGYTYGDLELIEALKDIIVWGDNSSARSKQVALGCSEIGDPCRRKIAMTMAGRPQVNFSMDPWPSIVGTSVHEWLSRKIADYQLVHGENSWMSELEVMASPWLPGHVDLYHRKSKTVLDLKNPSRTNYRKMRKEGVGDTYFAQVQGYGKGIKNMGVPVERVGIIMLPRDGNLTELWCKTFPFDEQFIDSKIAELEQLGQTLYDLNVLDDPTQWGKIPAEPSRLCGWCKFYRPELSVAGAGGCPGRQDDLLSDFHK